MILFEFGFVVLGYQTRPSNHSKTENMTVRDLRNFCNRKPASISWEDFDKMEVTMTGEMGMEYLADFEENSGVTAIPKEDGTIGYVFNLLTEDIEEQLYGEMDEFGAEDCFSHDLDDMTLEAFFYEDAKPVLKMYNQETFKYDKN